MKPILILLLFACFISCKTKTVEIFPLHFQKNLIPEGIAIDPQTETLFLNSLKENKIVKSNLDGSTPSEFIKRNQYEYLSGFGMTIKGDTLFALGNSHIRPDNTSVLLLLNTKTAQLIDSFTLNDSLFHYLNDLTISSNGDIYITDSESNKIYTIQRSQQHLEIFLENDEVANSNGISISDDGQYLYLASFRKGIRVIDIRSKKIINEPNEDYAGIDGMKYYNKSLIAIVNARRDTNKQGVFRFYLDDTKTKIIKKKQLVPYGKHFILPTTFDILNGYIYYVINTQLDNLDEVTNDIKDVSTLQSYELMKLKIE